MKLLLALGNGIRKLLSSYAEIPVLRLSLSSLNAEILKLLIKLCKFLLDVSDLGIDILSLGLKNRKLLIPFDKLSLDLLDLTGSSEDTRCILPYGTTGHGTAGIDRITVERDYLGLI